MCKHFWKLNSANYGVCSLCGTERDFKPLIDKALGYTAKPVRRDVHYKRGMVMTGGYYLQAKFDKPMRTVDYCFSTDWIE